MRPARSVGTWVLAAALAAALVGAPPAVAADAGSAADSSAATPRVGMGATVEADLRIAPARYSPGEALEVTVTGTLTTTAIRDVVCHSLTLTAMRADAPLLTRYSSTDRTPQLLGEVHTQEVRASLEIEAARLTGGGVITVTVDLQCSPIDAEGDWSVLDAQSERIASGRISPAAGTIALSNGWIFPDDEERRVRPVTVSVAAAGKTRIVVTRGRTTVWQSSSAKSSYRVSIPLSRTRQAGKYRITVTGPSMNAQAHFRVSRGWAPLVDSVAHWPRCSSITWAYDGSGAPGGSDTAMVADLEVAFDRFEELTGLDFARASGPTGDIAIGWAKAPYDGPDAMGGASESAGTLGSGVLTFFTGSDWASTPGFGVRGRGSLLYHEIGHILGLGHVSDKRLLMYPIHTVGKSPLTPQAGDIAGLRELYAPSSCR